MMLLLLLLSSCMVCKAAAAVCTNNCTNSTEDWCNQWRKVDGDVSPSLCWEWASEGRRCLSSCEKDGEDYNWCRTGITWDYCSAEGFTTRDVRCAGPCKLHSNTVSEYWWCSTDAGDTTKWDYCSQASTVERVHYSINGQECSGACTQEGEDYWWCYKAPRWQGKNSDPGWDYCSPSPDRTRYNKPCVDECATRGSSNFWCNIAGDTWDYCSPEPAASVKTAAGRICHGVCDFYQSSYQSCTSFSKDNQYFWDYCGASSSIQIFSSFWFIMAINMFLYKNI